MIFFFYVFFLSFNALSDRLDGLHRPYHSKTFSCEGNALGISSRPWLWRCLKKKGGKNSERLMKTSRMDESNYRISRGAPKQEERRAQVSRHLAHKCTLRIFATQGRHFSSVSMIFFCWNAFKWTGRFSARCWRPPSSCRPLRYIDGWKPIYYQDCNHARVEWARNKVCLYTSGRIWRCSTVFIAFVALWFVSFARVIFLPF